ncbi:MAG: hypothetical protein GXP41_05330 [Chloroflexi bacterium]|nr:hypothetical protein [Chloroflexota bacterium]
MGDKKKTREILLRERAETLEEMNFTKKSVEYEADYVYGEGDPGIVEREKGMALTQSLSAKLAAIDHALERLDQGVYGLCTECGKEINPERLEVLPYATLCIKCKSELERHA